MADNPLTFLDPDVRDPHSGAIVWVDAEIAAARDAVARLVTAARAVLPAIDAVAPAGVTYAPRDELRAALAPFPEA